MGDDKKILRNCLQIKNESMGKQLSKRKDKQWLLILCSFFTISFINMHFKKLLQKLTFCQAVDCNGGRRYFTALVYRAQFIREGCNVINLNFHRISAVWYLLHPATIYTRISCTYISSAFQFAKKLFFDAMTLAGKEPIMPSYTSLRRQKWHGCSQPRESLTFQELPKSDFGLKSQKSICCLFMT